jgi:hypothetical protein
MQIEQQDKYTIQTGLMITLKIKSQVSTTSTAIQEPIKNKHLTKQTQNLPKPLP